MNGLNAVNTSNPYKIKHPTERERTYNATLIIYVDYRNGVHIAKNRYGPTGNVGTQDLVNALTHVLGEQVFDGRTKMFQEGMTIKFKKAINKIIEEG